MNEPLKTRPEVESIEDAKRILVEELGYEEVVPDDDFIGTTTVFLRKNEDVVVLWEDHKNYEERRLPIRVLSLDGSLVESRDDEEIDEDVVRSFLEEAVR